MVAFFIAASVVSGFQETPPAPPLGTRIPRGAYEEEQVDQASRSEAFAIVERMGQCLVRGDAQGSMAFIATVPSTPKAIQALERLRPRLPDCLGNAAQGTELYGMVTLQMKESTLRGAVASALYRLQFAGRPVTSLPRPATVALILPPELSQPRDQHLVAGYAFAQCLTQSQPAIVRDVVISKIGSREENAALSQLAPFMSGCLSSGTTIKTDRNTLRLMLADSLYRWSITAAQGARQTAHN